jgi:PRC-barrel domain
MGFVNTANETVGDINEIVLGKDAKVAAVIVGVGGFLGMGEREVAMSFDSLRMSRDSNNNLILTVNATKDALNGAPEWRWDNALKGPASPALFRWTTEGAINGPSAQSTSTTS